MLYRHPLKKEQPFCLERVSELFTTEIQHLVTEATAEGHLFMQRLIEEYESGQNRFDKAGEALFVARLDERIVGVCGLNLDPYERDPDVGRVRHLFVEQSVRKMGIARTLVSEVVREAANHYRILLLRTRNPAADQLYRSLGFSTPTVYHHATHQMRFTR
ncbi:GNAT family N-acetyltransferase [Brevibacillus panacihumi]